MISGDDLYGWGVFDIPMERSVISAGSSAPRQGSLSAEPLRKLLRDVPWKPVASSVLLTLLCLLGLLLLRRTPEPLVPPEPQPVEVAVRLFEVVPNIPPPDVAEAPPQAAEVSLLELPDEPPPVPEEPPVTPLPEPEKTVQAAPVNLPEPIRIESSPATPVVPPPSSLQPPPADPPLREQPALPEQRTRVLARQETALPEPSRAEYEQRPEPVSPILPERTAPFKKEHAFVALGPGPHRPRSAERGTTPGGVPGAPRIALQPSDDAGLEDASPRLNARYANLSGSSDLALPSPRRTFAAEGGGASERLPKATAFAPPGSRKTVAMLPQARRSDSFGDIGRKAEPDLPGPPARTASLPRDRHAGEAPGESFDFLDLVGPAEFDPSVMMNLNQLQTCLDPEEELTLKTRLASMLSHPGQCRSGGVVFNIRHPESGYSIHIDLYNYEKREFQDRCAALRLAVYSCEARR